MAGILNQPMSGFLQGRNQALAENQANLQNQMGILQIQGMLQQQAERSKAGDAQAEFIRSLESMPEFQNNPGALAAARVNPGAVLPMLLPKTPKWQAAEIRQPDGTLKKGFVDINAASPEATFRPLGVEPVKQEYVHGQPVNPFAPTGPVNDPNKPFGFGPGGAVVPNNVVQAYELSKAREGATRVNTPISVNTDKTFLGEVAKDVAGQVSGGAQQARAAVGTINTVGQIRQALDSGKVMAGPGTSAVVVLNQLGSVLGITGADANERLTNTRKTIQGLAQLELDAAQQMKGQGQITESERSIIRRAASGDIDSMTTSELRTLTDTLDKVARSKIRANQQNVQRLQTNPNAAPVVPFMQVEEPPQYQSPNRGPVNQSIIDQADLILRGGR